MDRRIVFVSLALLLAFNTFGVYHLVAQGTNWTINGFQFRSTYSYGPVTFNSDAGVSAWGFDGAYVEFSDVSIGGGYSYSTLGFSCSSNAEMNITQISDGSLTYIVTAGTGQTSNSYIRFPSSADIDSVDNADSWSYDGPTRVLSVVYGPHASSVTIKVNFVRGGSTSDQFTNTRSVWMGTFQIIMIIFGLVIINSVVRGESGINTYQIIVFVTATGVLFLLLSVVNALWP